MCMLITNITDSLDDLGYPDTIELENGLKNINIIYFSKLVSWIACRLNLFSSIDSCVNEIINENDTQIFEIELSSLLKALDSPFNIESLKETNIKLGILNFLCGELIVAVFNCSKQNLPQTEEYNESEIAKLLRLILFLMNEELPKTKISINQLFDKIETNLKKLINEKKIENEESFLNEFQKNKLTIQFWKKLDEFNQLFKEEYEIRKKTLITRSDCTVSSFKWKKENQNENLDKKIDELYKNFSLLLKQEIDITLSDLIALKKNDYDELSNLSISKTHELCSISPPKNINLANQALQQKLSLHKFIIGNVPDRGGRTNEVIKPQQETFQQQYQQRNFRSNNNQSLNINPNRIQGSGWNQNYDKYKQYTSHQNQQGDNYQSSSHDYNRMNDNDSSDGRYNRNNQNNYRGRGNFRSNSFYNNRGKRGNNY